MGYLHFEFYNGAMSTSQCRRLQRAYRWARRRPTKAIVLMGGHDLWSNGIDLTAIEAAADPVLESWRNINAIDDLVRDIITTESHLTCAAIAGNAGAGGAILALAADVVCARDGVVLNPHYQTMHLFGSEYWTYLLPRRVGRPPSPGTHRPMPAHQHQHGQEHRPDRHNLPRARTRLSRRRAPTPRNPHRRRRLRPPAPNTSTSNASVTNRSNRYRPTATRNWRKCATTSPTPTITKPAAASCTSHHHRQRRGRLRPGIARNLLSR